MPTTTPTVATTAVTIATRFHTTPWRPLLWSTCLLAPRSALNLCNSGPNASVSATRRSASVLVDVLAPGVLR